MSDGIDLAEILGIDRDVALELAQASSALALARAEGRYDVPTAERDSGGTMQGQTVGQVNLAALNQAEVTVLQTATLATQAAVNLLVLDQAASARDLFRLASGLVAPYSSNDYAVLATCADLGNRPRVELEGSDADVSPWVGETLTLVVLASGSTRSDAMSVRGTPSSWVGAGASGEPPAGVSLANLTELRLALARATPNDGPGVWGALLTRLDALVIDATSPFEDGVGSEWWVNQTGSLFPLEPEVLILGLIGAIWRQRSPEFGARSPADPSSFHREDQPRMARAISVAADRLLEVSRES